MTQKKLSTKRKFPVQKRSARQETRDQYTVVLEDLRSSFKVFGEGLSFISDKLDEHTKQLAVMDARLERLQIELGIVKEELAAMDARLERLQIELGIVREELSAIRQDQVTRDEFKLLKTRVARLERTRR